MVVVVGALLLSDPPQIWSTIEEPPCQIKGSGSRNGSKRTRDLIRSFRPSNKTKSNFFWIHLESSPAPPHTRATLRSEPILIIHHCHAGYCWCSWQHIGLLNVIIIHFKHIFLFAYPGQSILLFNSFSQFIMPLDFSAKSLFCHHTLLGRLSHIPVIVFLMAPARILITGHS